MEELRECVFYRPRGGSGRQRRDGILMREQRQRCSEKWHCRHTRDETTKPAGAAKRDEAATRNGAESCQTVTCSLIVGSECRDAYECGLHVSLVQRKGAAPRGTPWAGCRHVATSRRRFVRRTARRRLHRMKACLMQSTNHNSQQTEVRPLFDRARFLMICGKRNRGIGVHMCEILSLGD